jgi:uncharacterized protein (TIGR00369 family)
MSDHVRIGPFWDFVAGRAAPPPVAALLGFDLVAVDPDAGTIEIAFTATGQFCNPVGDVQGGILGAMLDDTLGPCLVATLAPDQWAPTLELHTHFLAPAKVGRLVGRAHVVKRGRSVAFLAGELRQEGVVVATATATALVRG